LGLGFPLVDLGLAMFGRRGKEYFLANSKDPILNGGFLAGLGGVEFCLLNSQGFSWCLHETVARFCKGLMSRRPQFAERNAVRLFRPRIATSSACHPALLR